MTSLSQPGVSSAEGTVVHWASERPSSDYHLCLGGGRNGMRRVGDSLQEVEHAHHQVLARGHPPP